MLKDLINPTNFNVLVGKLGDVLVKALDQPLGYAINWGRIWSLWPVHLETACCSVEFGAASGPRYDVERFGIIEAFGSLRQCDLVVVQGRHAVIHTARQQCAEITDVAGDQQCHYLPAAVGEQLIATGKAFRN